MLMKGKHPFATRRAARLYRIRSRARVLEEHGLSSQEAWKVSKFLDYRCRLFWRGLIV